MSAVVKYGGIIVMISLSFYEHHYRGITVKIILFDFVDGFDIKPLKVQIK